MSVKMKRFIIFGICWCITLISYSQNYMAEYQSEDAKCHLTFNASAWRYDVTTYTEFKIEAKGFDASEISSPESTSFSTFNYRSLDKNYYIDEEIVPAILRGFIKGELIKPEWTILSDSVKTIENYTCLMAKGFVRGRDYIVWFTPDIPVSAGPWKLWGLPGLIVSAQSDDKKVNINMISLRKTENEPVEPTVNKTVTHEEFKTLYNETIQKFSRNLRAFLSSESAEVTNVNVSVGEHPDKSLLE